MLQAKQPMFIAWGPELLLLYNDSYAAILGAKHPRALGARFDAAWADIWPQFGPLVARVMAGEALSFEDLPIAMSRHGYPEDTWFSFSYTPLQDESGAIAGVFCACTETTEKVRGEQRLRANEAELEAKVAERTAELDRVWQNSRDLMAVVDRDGVFRAVNPSWTAILGYEPGEVIGHRVLDFVWPEDPPLANPATAGERDGRMLTDFQQRHRHKDGTPRWVSWRTAAERDLIYAYGRDITIEKEQAEVLRGVEEQLRQAQKMEAVGQLTGGIAHDFNNLLTGITGSLEVLRSRLAAGRTAEVDRYVVAAQGAAKRAASLTHRLLAFSRQQTLDPKPTDVNQLIAGMLDLIRQTLGPAITVEVTPAAELWTTLVDPNQLESALLNLAINARDAMPDGGRLTVRTANRALAAGEARAYEVPPGRYVEVLVADTGSGMTQEVISRAFDPFFTTKPLGMGTGLGLSMVYGFARQTGGQVRIESRPAEGTSIALYLPYHSRIANDEATPAPETAEAAGGRGETVLLIDDEPTVRILIAEVLGELGYVVLEAERGLEGLDMLRRRERIDLLITDVGLPGGMNGRQVADAGRLLCPGLKVLFITGYTESVVVTGGSLEPGMVVLSKPFTMEALATRVKAMLAS